MTTSYLQISGQLQAHADRLTALIQNAGAAVPPSAASTFADAIARAMTALQSVAALNADIARLVPPTHAGIPLAGDQANAIATQARTMASKRVDAANAALAALDGEAATVVKALDARFSVKKPAGLSDTLLVHRADELRALFVSKGGNSPALLLRAVSDRLVKALDMGDTATAYVITEALDDWRSTMGIDDASWEATIGNAMQARTSDEPQNDATGALYAALTNGGNGSLQAFVALAQVMIRAVMSSAQGGNQLAHERGSF